MHKAMSRALESMHLYAIVLEMYVNCAKTAAFPLVNQWQLHLNLKKVRLHYLSK